MPNFTVLYDSMNGHYLHTIDADDKDTAELDAYDYAEERCGWEVRGFWETSSLTKEQLDKLDKLCRFQR